MKVYIARQPIFELNREVFGYELLYRSNDKNAYDASIEGSKATRNLLSDMITVFKLQNLTNHKYAFVNFTKELLTQNVPKILDSKDIVIEILEDVLPDEALVKCIKELKKRDYLIALDDYCKEGPMDMLFPYVDIIKVDFSLVKVQERDSLAKELRKKAPYALLLAEKVETEEEFDRAKKSGYTLFQGYYFSKPIMFTKNCVDISKSTAMRLLKELNKEVPNYKLMTKILKTDAGMTYTILRQMNALGSYRGNQITDIKDALVRLGIDEIKKVTILKLMRSILGDKSKELTRISMVRACLAEYLAQEVGWYHLKEKAFMMGMFSMMDTELNEDLIELLSEIDIFLEVKEALKGTDNELSRILLVVKLFETGEWESMKEVFGVRIEAEKVSELYVKAVIYADELMDIM